MISLGTNISALRAIKQLNSISDRLSRVYERLSSGKRINRASDDPAGNAIAEELRSQQRLATMAIRNAQDGLSAIAVADAAFDSVSQILTRMSELAAQAANGAYSTRQRSALSAEFEALGSEVERIVATTRFNGINLVNGTGGISIQVGFDGGELSQLGVSGLDISLWSLGLGKGGSLSYSINGGSILEGQAASRSALDALHGAIESLSLQRSRLGASESRLGYAINNLTTQRENFAAAESRIVDADIAAEVAEMVRLSILQQVATAVLAQALRQPEIALILLR